MPIYEFRCSACGHIQEMIVTGSSDSVEMKCKECDGEEMERVLSRVSYSMGSSGASSNSCASATTRTCAPGKSCTSITLPGHSKD
jgi:putative FmdB family regulatory protein